MTLRDLTDKQLVRLYNRILERIQARFVGGRSFGVDVPTLRYCEPGLYLAYRMVRDEGRRRAL